MVASERGSVAVLHGPCRNRQLGVRYQRLELVHGHGIHPFERVPPAVSLSRRNARVPADAGGDSQRPDHLRRERGGHGRGECDQLDHGRAARHPLASHRGPLVLGVLPGGSKSEAYDINENDFIVGHSTMAVRPTPRSRSSAHFSFTWISA